MTKKRNKSKDVKNFIMGAMLGNSKNIVQMATAYFNISRQAVYRHIRSLINEGYIAAVGNTRSREYTLLKANFSESFPIDITSDFREDAVWRMHIHPYLRNVPSNVMAICEYGFCEILNNVADHSGTTKASIHFEYIEDDIEINIGDHGVGIFTKIYTELKLEDERHAILELSKGKLTTDPDKHSGEGIFFSSRIFDYFSILSTKLFFSHTEPGDDWLIESHDDNPERRGTWVTMKINTKTDRNIQDVFQKHSSGPNEYNFAKTHVPVALAKYEGENLVSRSQAKRLLYRFNRFKEVFLDFANIQMIGQAFADEIFRVFKENNPETKIIWIGANEQVEGMIKSILYGRNL